MGCDGLDPSVGVGLGWVKENQSTDLWNEMPSDPAHRKRWVYNCGGSVRYKCKAWALALASFFLHFPVFSDALL